MSFSEGLLWFVDPNNRKGLATEPVGSIKNLCGIKSRIDDSGAFRRRKMHSLRIATLLLIVACREVNSFDWLPFTVPTLPPIIPLPNLDDIIKFILGQAKILDDAVGLLEKHSDMLCLKEEAEPVKKYIESRKAMVGFLAKFAKNPKEYIDMKSECFLKLAKKALPFP
ncbi:hypothetical protein Y032_0015g2775 [Ancylostoma ceylanicum]|nr:hypothetical protein Y032_0015g2775 [Ancylostoma ceylanicum]